MSYFLLSCLIFLTPFIINPFSDFFFEPPKVIFAEILIETLLLITFLKKTSLLKSLNKSQLILSAVLFTLTIFNIFFLKSNQIFFGNQFRLQGIFLLWNLIALSLLSSRLNIDKFPRILFPISLGFLLLSSFLVEPDETGRAIGTLGEANALASSAIFFWPYALFFKLKNNLLNKLLKLGVLFAALAIILLSGSRSGFLAFGMQIIFLMLVKFNFGFKKALIVAALFIFISLILPFIEGGGWFENRSEIWKTAIFSGSQNMIFGKGFGNIDNALYNSSQKLNNNIRFQYIDSSHNFLLDYFVQGGIIGLGAVVLMVILSLKGLIKAKKSLEITTLLGLIFVLLFNPASVATLVAFWFLLGQGFKEEQR